jgi:hypothetical protein
MGNEFPLSPDTPWGTEVLLLMKERGYSFDHAFARVMARYLDAGDTWPLLDLLKCGGKPGAVAIKYLAPMMVPERRARLPLTNLQYAFHLVPNRTVGGQKRDERGGRIAQVIEFILAFGADTMAKGENPGKHFWEWFRYALEPMDFKLNHKRRFPWKAQLVRIKGGNGRRKNPELDMQKRVLACLVQQRVDDGESNKSAILNVFLEIKKLAKNENFPVKVGFTTIRNAWKQVYGEQGRS